jgi:hypothetical protein
MHIALQGALTGLVLGLFLVVVEYIFVKKGAEERAERLHRKPEFEVEDKKRIRQVVSFACLIPPAFALFAWLIWG